MSNNISGHRLTNNNSPNILFTTENGLTPESSKESGSTAEDEVVMNLYNNFSPPPSSTTPTKARMSSSPQQQQHHHHHLPTQLGSPPGATSFYPNENGLDSPTSSSKHQSPILSSTNN